MAWVEKWLGYPAADCAALAREVLASEFGIHVDLPAAPGGVRANDAAVRRGLTYKIARPLEGAETARDGDGVLMKSAGRRCAIGHHIGLWVDLDGQPACLHWRPALGGVLNLIRDLPAREMQVTGLYRWKPSP